MTNAEYVKATVLNDESLYELFMLFADARKSGTYTERAAKHKVCAFALTGLSYKVTKMWPWLDPTEDELEEGALLAFEACLE